jgi:hypothetical protein
VSGTAGDRRAAADLLARMERDPGHAVRAQAAYRGRHDVRDALWWAAHPGTTAPSGAADPTLELQRLRSAAFSREGQESDWVDAALPSGGTHRVRRAEALALDCEARIEQDRADLRALLAALAGRPDESVAGEEAWRERDAGVAEESAAESAAADPGGFAVSMATGPGSPAGFGPAPKARGLRAARRAVAARIGTAPVPARAESTGAAPGDDAPGGMGRPAAAVFPRVAALRSVLLRRPLTVTAALAVIGVLAGAGITWAALSGTGAARARDVPASGSLVEAPSWSTPTEGSPPALEVFTRDPTPEDTLPGEFFLDSPAATARLLYTQGALKVWGFLDRGQVCMFVQEGEAASGTCVARDSFGYAGITLMLSAEGTMMPGPTSGLPGEAITDLTWTPQGQIQIRSAPLGQ